MKRAELIRKLEEAGCGLIRHGGNHDWYRNPKTGTAHFNLKQPRRPPTAFPAAAYDSWADTADGT